MHRLALGFALAAAAASAQNVAPGKLKYVESRVEVDKVEKGHTGFIRVVGEFHNQSDQWIVRPCVEIEYLDAAGKPIVVESVSTITKQELGMGAKDEICSERNLVGPGQVAVFKKIRDQKYLKGATYASHKVGEPKARLATDVPAMTVENFKTDKTMIKKSAYHAVSGTLKNAGKTNCHMPQVVLGLYADGKLYDVSTAMLDGKDLAAGKSAPFSRKSIPDPDNKVTEVKHWPDCTATD